MLKYPRINEIAYRIEGYAGNDSNYRIVRAELSTEEETERWSVTVQRKENDGKDFMQEIMGRINGYKETVHFRVLSAYVNGCKRDKLSLDFMVEDWSEGKDGDERTGEKDEDGRKE